MLQTEYPSTAGVRRDVQLAQQVHEIFACTLADIVTNNYNGLVLEPYLRGVAQVFFDVAAASLSEYRALGALVRDLGGSPALQIRIKNDPCPLNEDADSHAAVVGRRMLAAAAESKTQLALVCKCLADEACDKAAALLTLVAAQNERQAAALLAADNDMVDR